MAASHNHRPLTQFAAPMTFFFFFVVILCYRFIFKLDKKTGIEEKQISRIH